MPTTTIPLHPLASTSTHSQVTLVFTGKVVLYSTGCPTHHKGTCCRSHTQVDNSAMWQWQVHHKFSKQWWQYHHHHLNVITTTATHNTGMHIYSLTYAHKSTTTALLEHTQDDDVFAVTLQTGMWPHLSVILTSYQPTGTHCGLLQHNEDNDNSYHQHDPTSPTWWQQLLPLWVKVRV